MSNDVGGKEVSWVMIWVVSGGSRPARNPIRHIGFRTTDETEAMRIVLETAQRNIRRMRRIVGKTAIIMAMPEIVKDGKKVLDGDRMIRNRLRYGSLRRLRDVKRPATALVCGYGPEAVEALHE